MDPFFILYTFMRRDENDVGATNGRDGLYWQAFCGPKLSHTVLGIALIL